MLDLTLNITVQPDNRTTVTCHPITSTTSHGPARVHTHTSPVTVLSRGVLVDRITRQKTPRRHHHLRLPSPEAAEKPRGPPPPPSPRPARTLNQTKPQYSPEHQRTAKNPLETQGGGRGGGLDFFHLTPPRPRPKGHAPLPPTNPPPASPMAAQRLAALHAAAPSAFSSTSSASHGRPAARSSTTALLPVALPRASATLRAAPSRLLPQVRVGSVLGGGWVGVWDALVVCCC